jgi:hypothetical protein
MVFQAQTHDVLEMAVVNVCVDSEKSFEYDFYNLHEVLGKRDPF